MKLVSNNGPQEILGLAQGFMESRILLSAAELNLFTILKSTPLSAHEIASKIGADRRALSMLLDAVTAMGLLVKQEGRYSCEQPVARFLAEDSRETVLPMVRHMASLWPRWSRLTDVVKTGKIEEFQFSRDRDELHAFIGAMHVAGTPLAKQVVAAVDIGESRALLDVGGGSGTYTIEFLRAVPEMRATIFDLPEVIEMARERLRQERLLDRATLVSGSYHDRELPSGFDLALLSAIIHSNSPQENLELYKKIFRSLDPGGRLLIRDHVMEPNRTRPKDGTIFAINMLVGTSGGGTYTYEEIESALREAGFTQVTLLRPGAHMDAVVEARR
jgi:ubiquinone/menaquinone biosynthesis C-methylase UbiE